MYKRNNGISDREILQNQFTAYVKRAIHNKRIRYLMQQDKYSAVEVGLSDVEAYVHDSRNDMETFMDMEAMRQALQTIRDKERYIILARVIEEKSVSEIAEEMGLSYRAVTSLYYRGMRRLRLLLEGGEDE